MKPSLLIALTASSALALTGCAVPKNAVVAASHPPQIAQVTPAQRDLIFLPPPAVPVPIAVYSFTDQTGQLKPSENTQSLSRAVTQGGTSVLIKALRDAGNGNWFTVVERERLDNLLKERQIIQEMRKRYLGEQEISPAALPALLFAGILLEGGIVGYDANTQSGGLGARFLGIGGDVQYRQNTVTVYLRAISVKTGEVLGNVVTSKSVASVAMQANVFKFVQFDELLEGEAGISANEPGQIATQAAIEKAVYALIMEGAEPGGRQLWSFADQAAGDRVMTQYREEKDRALAAAFRAYDDPNHRQRKREARERGEDRVQLPQRPQPRQAQARPQLQPMAATRPAGAAMVPQVVARPQVQAMTAPARPAQQRPVPAQPAMAAVRPAPALAKAAAPARVAAPQPVLRSAAIAAPPAKVAVQKPVAAPQPAPRPALVAAVPVRVAAQPIAAPAPAPAIAQQKQVTAPQPAPAVAQKSAAVAAAPQRLAVNEHTNSAGNQVAARSTNSPLGAGASAAVATGSNASAPRRPKSSGNRGPVYLTVTN